MQSNLKVYESQMPAVGFLLHDLSRAGFILSLIVVILDLYCSKMMHTMSPENHLVKNLLKKQETLILFNE